MRKMLLLFAMIASFSFAVAPVAMAQNDVDIESISQAVTDADLNTLMANLETPMSDEALPDGFTNATYVDPKTATGEEGVLPASDLEGSEGSVAYTVDWDPTAVSASPEAEASPTGSGFAVRIATLNYVFFDSEISSSDLEDFKSGAEEGLQGEEGAETTVETIQVAGTDAVLLTYNLESEGVQSIVQMVALPVGNTMVISMLVEAGMDVDADAVQTAAQDLTLAGAAYLGTVAEDAQ